QPQGHGDPRRRRRERLPAPAGTDFAQRAGRMVDRLRLRRAQLPDRAPPLPQHAPTEPAPLPGTDPGLLPGARPGLQPDQPDRLVRPGPALPARRRTSPGPAVQPRDRLTRAGTLNSSGVYGLVTRSLIDCSLCPPLPVP